MGRAGGTLRKMRVQRTVKARVQRMMRMKRRIGQSKEDDSVWIQEAAEDWKQGGLRKRRKDRKSD